MSHLSIRVALFALLTVGTLAARLATAQASNAVPGASGLSGTLAQYHGYLFTPEKLSELDEVNHRLRDAEDTMRRGETEAARAEALRVRGQQAAKLAQLLDGLPSVMDISLPDSPQPLSEADTMVLPGNSGAVLFRVNADGGNPQFVVSKLDFAYGPNCEGEACGVQVTELDPTRTTYVLLSMKNVPSRTVSMRVTFATIGGKHYIMPITLATPKQGRLQLSVLSDDTGEPTPAMVRLVWKTNNSEYKPSNALDFASKFDAQGWMSTGLRGARLPGKWGGNYWCVPGPTDMMLPPGDWEVTIRRGTEHLPIVDTFTVPPGGSVERSYRPKRWVDMRESGWYSGDTHIHFQLLSEYDAEQLMTWLQAEDVHLGNVLKMGDIYRTYFEQRGFGPEYRVREDDYILVPGQEDPRTGDLGHTISLNITDRVRDTAKYYQYDWTFENVAKQGGLSGFAHGDHGGFHVHRGMTLVAPEGLIDFLEVMEVAELGTDLYYDFLNLGFKLTASAGSDVPWGGTIGEVRVYAYTGKGRFTADKWFDAVERGRTFVTNGPMIDFRVDNAYPGDEVRIKKNKPLRVRARTWGAEGFTVPIKLQIIQHGEVIHSVEADASNPTELEIDFEMDPGQGSWLAARVEGSDGYRAHTTPIYVVRDSLRFWKYDAVEELLAKRGASLIEIEGFVADALVKQEKDEIDANKWHEEVARQAEALHDRVRKARRQYDELRKQYESEAAARE